uniref:hypothetical protein n=1 Tax=Petrachloros mirabilis TaxID=2918835 RepID=UPI001EE8F26E
GECKDFEFFKTCVYTVAHRERARVRASEVLGREVLSVSQLDSSGKIIETNCEGVGLFGFCCILKILIPSI